MKKGPSMSEFDGQALAAPQAGLLHGSTDGHADAEPAISAGTMLRQAREAAGLHIAALAVALKVPVKKIEALESDRFDQLPDSVFVRALAASVCRTLKLDAVPVLALLPRSGKSQLGQQRSSINTPFRSPSDGAGPSLWGQISRPAVLAGLLLLLGALVLIFMPAVQQQETLVQPVTEPFAAGSVSTYPPATMPAAPALTSLQAQDGVKPAATLDPDLAATKPALAPVLQVPLSSAPVLPLAGSNPNPAAALAVPSAAPSTASGIIVFTAKGESWVEVTDAKGSVVLRRILAAGESAGASGVLPLAAVVGRVDATQVQVRGQAFDLMAVSKDNVARFEVK